MGVVLGTILGLGLCLVLAAWGAPAAARQQRPDRLEALLAQAGVDGTSARAVRLASVGGGLLVGLVTLILSGVAALAVVASVATGRAPVLFLRHQARARQARLRELWPDVVDDLASAVRAGRSLPEALGGLAVRGPELLRPAFAAFGEDHRATGSFDLCLDRLGARLADATADQVLETMRLAREVGGSDLGSVLRTLSAFLREELRTRGELEVRQGWAVNAARMALVAPWGVLALLAGGSQATVHAYNQPAGLAVLVIGAVTSFGAYRLMLAIGTLPEPPRVLRA
jgi:tight adherence protein B